jgi:hypothetical protein
MSKAKLAGMYGSGVSQSVLSVDVRRKLHVYILSRVRMTVRNGGTPVGYSGRIALRREQCGK